MRHRARSLWAALSLLVGSLVFQATPAGAVLGQCNVVHQIFMYGNVLLSNSNGTTNRIYFQQRTLDADCKGQAYSTAHSARGIPQDAGYGTFIEMGWARLRNADGSVSKCLYRNKAVDFSSTPVFDCGNISDFDFGEYDRYRVQNLSGTTDWRVYTDLNDDGNFDPLHTYNSTWSQGWPEGETERKGNDTGGQDDHRSLMYYTDAGNWNDWPYVLCGWDGDPSWEPNVQSATRYIVQEAPDQCDP